ncbi:hypothetical protein LAJ19_16870 (plasmid) [Deinococcus taeanensis]|uniref:hypothetical protein n=1 Tax=Deinococcus taeanensis TaxID=2737050 RepID=UPI001CDCE684|nr:hypothetical protein [Deinococcus taeanensis]UBV44458.1 hypothetical protein LAJ19_16870 [Deinococcus taeanensis]
MNYAQRMTITFLLTTPCLTTACAPALRPPASFTAAGTGNAAPAAGQAPTTSGGSRGATGATGASPVMTQTSSPGAAVRAGTTLQAAAPATWTAGLTGLGYNSTLGVTAVPASAPEAAAALRTSPSPEAPTYLLRIDFDNTKADPDQDLKKAYALVDFRVPLNFSGVNTVSFVIFNPTAITLDAALTVRTTAAREWQESRLVAFGPGWSHLHFPLTEPTFKAERSGWANTALVRDLNDVRGLALMVYPHQGIKNYVLVTSPITDAAVGE